MVLKRIISLGIIEAIEEVEKVDDDWHNFYIREGVWNKWKIATKEQCIRVINNSPYGADVFRDENEDVYILVPGVSDMW